MADKMTIIDRGEAVSMMEPLLLSETSRHRHKLLDMAVELASRSSGFRRSLPSGVQVALSDLVRAMNCYYSNLIEGHDTHPIEIERALKNDYSADLKKRNLQLEAMAHIEVQKWIDHAALQARATASDAVKEIHRRFGELLPEDMRIVEDPESGERTRMIPGELRHRDVKVGQHIAISPGAVPRFLARFEAAYNMLGKAETILAAAAAHHRLLWIHPFLDGNGRVARLMSYAMLRETLDTGGLWSIARGLARSVRDYKSHLAACDLPRRNDLDGRGHLSEEALAEFTRYFLETCLDQVAFMEQLVQPDKLRARIMRWASAEIQAGTLPAQTTNLLEAILFRGELPRGDVANVLGNSPRHARRVVSPLLERGILVADDARAPLRLALPANLAHLWMPGLFPEVA